MSAARARTGLAPCPICRKPAATETAPFCSSRCAEIDLGRWLGERYVLPGPPDETAEPDDAEGALRARGEAGQG